MKKAQNLINDVDDSPYIALALKTNCPIWSNDKGLKHQSKVKILSTEDLIEILF
ncbi:MAG: PIN domain-containing protein [Candidatus Nanoarchaeia archaeon]